VTAAALGQVLGGSPVDSEADIVYVGILEGLVYRWLLEHGPATVPELLIALRTRHLYGMKPLRKMSGGPRLYHALDVLIWRGLVVCERAGGTRVPAAHRALRCASQVRPTTMRGLITMPPKAAARPRPRPRSGSVSVSASASCAQLTQLCPICGAASAPTPDGLCSDACALRLAGGPR